MHRLYFNLHYSIKYNVINNSIKIHSNALLLKYLPNSSVEASLDDIDLIAVNEVALNISMETAEKIFYNFYHFGSLIDVLA